MATPATTPTPPFPARRRSRLGIALARRNNPLWRPSDSLRSRLRALLVVALLASVGLSTGFALTLYRDDRAAAAKRDAHLHSVQAVLLTAPGKAPATDPGAGASAEVRWNTGGSSHEASVPAPVNAATGTRIELWLDSAGKPAAAPASSDASAASVTFLGILVLLVAASLATCAYDAVRGWADRTDEVHWDHDWRRVEPVWSLRD